MKIQNKTLKQASNLKFDLKGRTEFLVEMLSQKFKLKTLDKMWNSI